MTGRMDWRRARKFRGPRLDTKTEMDLRSQDPAARWLAGVEKRRRKPQHVRKGKRRWRKTRPYVAPQKFVAPDWTVTGQCDSWNVVDAAGGLVSSGFRTNTAAWEWVDRYSGEHSTVSNSSWITAPSSAAVPW